MRLTRTLLIFTIFYLSATNVVLASERQAQLSEAQFNFDRAAAEALLPTFLKAARDANNDTLWLEYAEAALLVAELRRGDYEHLELDKKARRELGKQIDETANSALEALGGLPESSERYRLEADLLGTMIRSKFKGMKYQPRVEKAIAEALELDKTNANAWVSNARRPLFAPPNQGGDPARALLYLDRALKINPEHVQALLFRGAAHAKLGNPILANVDWDRAADLNPNTADARDRLLIIEMPGESNSGN